MTLLNELNGEKGSFILELRVNLSWNHALFINLIMKLFREFQNTKENTILQREIASGVWFISTFIKNWTEHNNFPKKFSQEYYNNTYQLINDVSWAYFMADSPYNLEADVQSELLLLEKMK